MRSSLLCGSSSSLAWRSLSSSRYTCQLARLSTLTSPPLHPYGDAQRTRMLALPSTHDTYETITHQFKWPTPQGKMYNIGRDICDKHVAQGRGQLPALIYEDATTGEVVTCNFSKAKELSDRMANTLIHRFGVQKGDRVAILMSQSIETALAHMATYKTGAITVPLFILFGPEALEYRLNDCGARVLFIEPSKLDEVLALKQSGKLPDLKHIIVSPPLSAMYYETQTSHPQPDDSVHDLSTLLQQASPIFHPIETHMDDPALIIYTSGTTGSPKGALHAHRTLLGHLSGVEFPQEFFPRQGDLFWTPADWAWIGGLIDVLLPSLHHGIPVLANRFKKFDADLAFRTIEKFSVRNMFLPPTALKLMRQGVDHPEKKYKLNVRSIGSGGESLGESLLDWGKTTFGVNINEFYGQTECNLVLGNNSIFPCVPGSMGRPMPGHIVKIVDDEGHELEKGRIGNIAIKSPDPVMFLRYWNKPEATQDKFRNNFLLTGDLGKEDDKGYFWFFGRNDDVIKSAGYRIGPAEIENCLIKHPCVSNAAVIGVPDKLRGELVKAFIILRPGALQKFNNNESELRTSLAEHVKGKLAMYEYPREIEFVDALPMTTTGKIIRKDLKAQEIQKMKEKGLLPS